MVVRSCLHALSRAALWTVPLASCLVGEAVDLADVGFGCKKDFVCDPDENEITCPHDCFTPTVPGTADGTKLTDAEEQLVRALDYGCPAMLNYRSHLLCAKSCDGEGVDPGETEVTCAREFAASTCGKGEDGAMCDPGESPEACPWDCHEPECEEGEACPTSYGFGDGCCDASENSRNSPDCSKTCGDGFCSEEESRVDRAQGEEGGLCRASCPRDCEWDVVSFCGDGSCAGTKDENPTNCWECTEDKCGDGVTTGKEPCDDGNAVETDACTNGCKAAACGDGVVQGGVEGCDDGNTENDDGCVGKCALAACGDGYVRTVVGAGEEQEECDEGRSNGDEGACTGSCKVAKCGDGLVQAGVEECDDGNEVEEDGCVSCKLAACGDGVVEAGVEACEDGNEDATDACNMCQQAKCGDGAVQVGVEACDDGNMDEQDGCSSDCIPVEHRRVFVTSGVFTGKLGGLLGADEICEAAATAAGLADPGTTFKAWLGDAETGPVDRFDATFTGVYELLDGTPVAHGWADLVDGGLAHAIDRDEHNMGPIVASAVWTHASADGTVGAGPHCAGWTDPNISEDGDYGVSDATGVTWTVSGKARTCDAPARLYCFENPL